MNFLPKSSYHVSVTAGQTCRHAFDMRIFAAGRHKAMDGSQLSLKRHNQSLRWVSISKCQSSRTPSDSAETANSDMVLNVEIERLPVEGLLLQVCVPADLEQVIGLAERGACLTPFWSRVWPSGEALAADTLRFPLQAILSSARSVADVGAGLGVAGLAAAAAGAQRVTMFEAEPLALDLAAESAQLMGCGSVHMYKQPDWYPEVELDRGITYSLLSADDEDEMELGTGGAGDIFAEYAQPLSNTELKLVCGDWQETACDASHTGAYDVLLASDVLYSGAEAAAGLAPALASLLAPGGVLAVADPFRRTPPVTRDAFLKAAEDAGLVLDGTNDITLDPEDLDPEDSVECSILLMLFRRVEE